MTPNVKILFRHDRGTEEEYEACLDTFGKSCVTSRCAISPGSLVIGRYSCLPFYKELCDDLKVGGSRLIHDVNQFAITSQIQNWYPFLDGLTPQTWFNVGYATVPETEHGWVVKGQTNSRKHQWNTHMFSKDREGLKSVAQHLMNDPLIENQGLVFREYVPLKVLGEGINGLPLTNEWRVFIFGTEILAHGFYWSYLDSPPEVCEGLDFVREKVLPAMNEAYLDFYVVDIAETAKGEWIVIEVNEGQMSGLSLIDPYDFYGKLRDLT